MKPAGSVVAAGSSGAAAGVKLDPGGAKLEPGAGGRQEERLRDERERERERSYSRDEPFDRPMPRGAPPPLPRDGPPPYGFRDRPPPPHLRRVRCWQSAQLSAAAAAVAAAERGARWRASVCLARVGIPSLPAFPLLPPARLLPALLQRPGRAPAGV